MALTLDDLRTLLDVMGLKYAVFPDRAALLAGFRGLNGSYQFIIHLELNGTFLQFRSLHLLHCPSDNPHVGAVLRLLAELNYRHRLVKFGWDSSDGEIVAYADLWVMDNTVTRAQLERMIHNLLPTVDLSYPRIQATINTGQDPGEASLADVIQRAAGTLPSPIRRILEKLIGRKSGEPERTEQPEIVEL